MNNKLRPSDIRRISRAAYYIDAARISLQRMKEETLTDKDYDRKESFTEDLLYLKAHIESWLHDIKLAQKKL